MYNKNSFIVFLILVVIIITSVVTYLVAIKLLSSEPVECEQADPILLNKVVKTSTEFTSTLDGFTYKILIPNSFVKRLKSNEEAIDAWDAKLGQGISVSVVNAKSKKLLIESEKREYNHSSEGSTDSPDESYTSIYKIMDDESIDINPNYDGFLSEYNMTAEGGYYNDTTYKYYFLPKSFPDKVIILSYFTRANPEKLPSFIELSEERLFFYKLVRDFEIIE